MAPDKREIIAGFVSAAIIFFTLFASGVYLLDDPMLGQTLSFSLTANAIASRYPLPVSQRSAFDGAERSLFSLLDPFSFRIEKNDYEYLLEEATGEYGGIGISVVARDTALMVMSVREGGPAYRAGIKSGDWILEVDSVKVPIDNPASATDLIRGPSNTDVSLMIYRPPGADTVRLTMTRSSIKLEHLSYYGLTESGCAYIRAADFEAGAAEDLIQSVRELERQHPRGYIIDLSGNPGGYLNEAIDAADIFLEKGALIVGTHGRSRWDNRRFTSSSDPLTDKPVIVMTDFGTASASEIFAGALRAAGRCVVIGDTTFGKGLVQSVYGLFNDDAIRLTISRYYFADGRYLNPPDSQLSFSGLAPDIVYTPPEETAFQQIILSGFLLYDFVESEETLLSSYPDRFNYPDTVIYLFQRFASARDVAYESRLTKTMSLVLLDQYLAEASDAVMTHLNHMQDLSRRLDDDVYRRHADFLKYHIRRIMVEKKSGRAASYRDVIVPARPDIRLAEQILNDPEKYQSFQTRRAEVE